MNGFANTDVSKSNALSTSVVCYFCNEAFENSKLLQWHIKQCRSMLVECSRKCGAWLQRPQLQEHEASCSGKQPNTYSNPKSYSVPNTYPPPDNHLQQNANSQRINQLLSRQSIHGTNSLPNAHSQHNLHIQPNSQPMHNAHSQPNKYSQPSINSLPNTNSLPSAQSQHNLHLLPNSQTKYNTNSQQNTYSQPDGYLLDSTYSRPIAREPMQRRDRPLSSVEDTHSIAKEMMQLRLYLEDEKNQRVQLKTEINKMKRQYNLSEERNQILLATIATLRKTIEEESMQKNSVISQIREDLKSYKESSPDITDITTQLELRLDSLQTLIEREQIERSHLELILNGQDGRLRSVHKLEIDVEDIKNDIINGRQITNEQMTLLGQDMGRIEMRISEGITASNRNLQDIESSQELILNKLQLHSDDISKYQLLHCESKNVKAIVEEDSVKIELMNKEISELKSSLVSLQRERFTSMTREINNNFNSACDNSGHLIWRIDKVEEKLKDCIDNESVLISPIFLSSKYGYTLQAELYLNGIGKWRGRHITASVFLIPGDYDPLLQWPASLVANIVIKDQAVKKAQAMDIVKVLPVKKKETDEDFKAPVDSDSSRSSDRRKSQENLSASDREKKILDANIKRQYVFIPHTSLDKLEYIKNDVMFVEIIVTKSL